MKYTKEEIAQFKEIVCPNCVSKDRCKNKNEHWFMSCGKIFNWKLYHTEDGSCPQTKEYINNLK